MNSLGTRQLSTFRRSQDSGEELVSPSCAVSVPSLSGGNEITYDVSERNSSTVLQIPGESDNVLAVKVLAGVCSVSLSP